jgi:hypothetical protein
MEDWELEFKWLQVRHMLRDLFSLDNLPDLNAVLLLIGIQELGYTPEPLSKEAKQDLMHIGVCTLLSLEGYYVLDGHDAEGWPHFRPLQKVDVTGEKEQEKLLISCCIAYFQEHVQPTS